MPTNQRAIAQTGHFTVALSLHTSDTNPCLVSVRYNCIWALVADMKRERMQVFVSYSHRDEKLRIALDKHLSMLKRGGRIDEWHDRRIDPGSEFESEIDAHLNRVQLVLLLVSPDFLASEYCYSKEMERAMQMHESGAARVVPVILRPVDWKDAPFAKLSALPTEMANR